MTIQNLVNHELIGLNTKVLDSKNRSIIGLEGMVVDETKSMLVIHTDGGNKMIPKQHNQFRFVTNSQDIIIDGSSISKRPEDRIKVKV